MNFATVSSQPDGEVALKSSDTASTKRRHRYPVELIDVITLANGRRVTIRPILPQDDTVTRSFFRNLSAKSRLNRFMSAFHDVPDAVLSRLTHVDYRQHLALIAEVFTEGREIAVGEARYVVSPDGRSAEFAVSVADEWQRRGLGSLMLCRLAKSASKAGIATITGETLASNTAMMHLAYMAGFSFEPDPEIAGVVRLSLSLAGRDPEGDWMRGRASGRDLEGGREGRV